MRPLAALYCALTLSAAPVAAEISLSMPIDCSFGKTCFIEDYVDHDPTPNRQTDFACNFNARDGHKGTDFALLSYDALEDGVDVLAAAPGTVLRTRDSMPDDRLMRGVTSQNACGNAVLIQHADDWTTLYCHLRLGSVVVEPGDTVKTGDVLGLVGLSGQTNYPHVHVTVMRGDALIDPFHPDRLNACGEPGDTLWDVDLPYTRSGILTAGFSDDAVTMQSVVSGDARVEIGRPDLPIVIYTRIAYGTPGDVVQFDILTPQGDSLLSEEVVLDTDQSNQMRFVGRRAPSQGWPEGEYEGTVRLTRDDVVIGNRITFFTVRP